jgi:hypothetical protein
MIEQNNNCRNLPKTFERSSFNQILLPLSSIHSFAESGPAACRQFLTSIFGHHLEGCHVVSKTL